MPNELYTAGSAPVADLTALGQNIFAQEEVPNDMPVADSVDLEGQGIGFGYKPVSGHLVGGNRHQDGEFHFARTTFPRNLKPAVPTYHSSWIQKEKINAR